MVNLSYANCSKKRFQNMEIHLFLRLFPPFLVCVLENAEKAEFKNYIGARKLNEERTSK